jgi:XTP/dITP diphosphohydrolase
MARVFTGDRLVVATHNPGKLAEIGALIAPFGVAALGAGALGLAAPEETGESFIANAELKARDAAEASGLPALADDSGLVVPALGGAPGIHSARWAGPERDFGRAMRRVEEALGDDPDRRAYFVAVLALAWPDGHIECFRGEAHGRLVFPPRGSHGFGYDPIFLPEGETRTFGEMLPEEKNRLNHRAKAFAKLVAGCLAPPR